MTDNFSRGHIQIGALLVLLVIAPLSVLAGLYASGSNGQSGISLTIGEQQELIVTGDNLILKIRLNAGVTAKLWGDKTCAAPIQKAMTITGSGNYTFPLVDVPHQDRVYVCLLSSDSKLNDSVAWPPVHSDNTTTAITSHSPNPSVVGQLVTVGFTITPETPGVGTPTGNVTVSDGSGATCTVTVAAGNCSITFASASSHILTAVYSGDDNFNSSTSTSLTHTVGRTNTTTVISSKSPSPSVPGQPVSIGFTVTPATTGYGTVTGNVTVSDGLGNSCTGTVAAGACSITFATSGVKPMTATYAGDVTYNASTSSGSNHSVRDFSISVSPSSQTVKAGASTTYTITVTPISGFTGTVNLSCGTMPANSACSMSPASIVISGPNAGTRNVTVTTGSSTAKGNYTITFTGTFGTGVPASGGLTRSVGGTLKVN